MNKTILITTAILAGTAAVVAAIRNRKLKNAQRPLVEAFNTRHLTDVFSKAKQG